MKLQEKRVRAAVIGSGAAGLASAVRLASAGVETLLLTENVSAGTSRNTGSDKQTYYKLSLAAGDGDSVLRMAEDLFAGGAVDGDTALCEAALSPRGFFSLVEAGVPFPCTEFGEYMGYQTDHDRGRRATSAGPYTSRMMTECLERRVRQLGVPVLDSCQALRLLAKDGRIRGVLCLLRDRTEKSREPEYLLLWCDFLVLATGGPAGIYRDSVYPVSQLGSSGMALEAGVPGKNLTEWQFGMASLAPRWNVSGSYMQVIPRFLSTDTEGRDPREFLTECLPDPGEHLSLIFLKGYQWPFDVAKTSGSSLIDLLVYRETVLRGRRVFLDYTCNPLGLPLPADRLIPEASGYLRSAGILEGTPVQRLRRLNEPAYQFYLEHGVDLEKNPLEIAVCAQHHNGGLAADANWETEIRNLFAVGEVCGSHGIVRPGGSALNAGQVGAIRAAECIRRRVKSPEDFAPLSGEEEAALRQEAAEAAALADRACGSLSCGDLWRECAARMSACAGMIRDSVRMRETLDRVRHLLANYPESVRKPEPGQVSLFYRLRDMLITQQAVLTAMCDYAEQGGSRGSGLYSRPDGVLPRDGLPDLFRFLPEDVDLRSRIQETRPEGCSWRPVRPVPEMDYFFENQWKAFRLREGL